MKMPDFTGVKLALIHNNHVLSLLRDKNPDIAFPNMWDVTGGTRDGDESPIECAFRETKEELGLTLNLDSIIWQQYYEHLSEKSPGGYFMVAKITDEDCHYLTLGNEGQCFTFFTFQEFLALKNVIGFVRERFNDYLYAKSTVLS